MSNGALRVQATRVSGSREIHYSPKATVLLDQSPVPGQGFITLAHIDTPAGTWRLTAPQNGDEFAAL